MVEAGGLEYSQANILAAHLCKCIVYVYMYKTFLFSAGYKISFFSGEKFLQITSKMASEKTTPQLQVGGACTSVAVAMGGVEGRYPDAMEGWSQREKQLTQTLEWLSFHQNCQQVTT